MALRFFDECLKDNCRPNVITFNSLITACAQGTLALGCFICFSSYRQACPASTTVLNMLLKQCSSLDMLAVTGAQWEKARELYELMQQQGCTPDVVTYTALISAFERGGKWHLALQVGIISSSGCITWKIPMLAIPLKRVITRVIWNMQLIYVDEFRHFRRCKPRAASRTPSCTMLS